MASHLWWMWALFSILVRQKVTAQAVYEPEAGVFLILSAVGENCEDACQGDEANSTSPGPPRLCSSDSLLAGAPFTTSSSMEDTVEALGAVCNGVEDEADDIMYPAIDPDDRCTPSNEASRSDYDCSTVANFEGGPGRRICSCFQETAEPSQAPTTEHTPSIPLPPDSPYVPDGYILSWRDDFSGSELDSTSWSRGLVYDDGAENGNNINTSSQHYHVVWHPKQGGTGLLNNNYDAYIVDENSYLENGTLVLANKQETIVGTDPVGNFEYTSGWINSLRKRFINGSNKRVYVELSAQFPTGPKVWPAIWLVAEDLTWPPEIDIWEYFGMFFEQETRLDEMHFRNIWGEWPSTVKHKYILEDFHEQYSGFHTLGWIWTEYSMEWFIDGVNVSRKDRGVEIPYTDWPDQDMFFIINNGLMSAVNGSTTPFPNYLLIDYIALYEEEGEAATSPPFVLVLGEVGESCTSACQQHSSDDPNGRQLQCTYDSLRRGDVFATANLINTTATEIGSSCAGGIHSEQIWRVNPQVSTENYCFPSPSHPNTRTNYNCDATSMLTDNDTGEPTGQRICSCEVMVLPDNTSLVEAN